MRAKSAPSGEAGVRSHARPSTIRVVERTGAWGNASGVVHIVFVDLEILSWLFVCSYARIYVITFPSTEDQDSFKCIVLFLLLNY